MLRDYLPLLPLGNGATGIVFLARPITHPQSLLAIKAFRRSCHHGLHRARNEELILSKLLAASHPHTPFLPHLHSVFDDGEFRFLVLDYCAGGDMNTLRQLLPDKRFSTAAIRFYAAEVVLALELLHEQGIVYRDLKPENILISSDGHIMLTDFDLSVALARKKPSLAMLPLILQKKEEANYVDEEGDDVAPSCTCFGCSGQGIKQRRRVGPVGSRQRIVPVAEQGGLLDDKTLRASSSGRLSDVQSHSFIGTEEYIAPEVIRGDGHGFAVDWWALGVLLHEMAHARTPFSGKTARQTFDNILHQELKMTASVGGGPRANLISQLLVKDPAHRLGSTRSAAEIKAHPFFAGICWDALHDISRPPFIPPPSS